MSLVEFLEALVADPRLEAKFDKAPEAVMRANGVSNQDIVLLLTGTIQEIRDEILKSRANAAVIMIKMFH